MLTRINFVLLAFAAALIPFIGFAEEAAYLSLKQAEDCAIERNYRLNASLQRLEQGYYGYKASKAYFLPTLSASGNLEAANSNNGAQNAIQLTQPLFDKVAIYNYKEAQIQWEILRLDTRQHICNLLFKVRNAYYTVLLHQAHLAVDQMIIQLWENEVKRHERHLEVGAGIPYELNQAKLHLKGAWIDYYSTQTDMKSAQISLSTILGLSPTSKLILTDNEIPFPSVSNNQCTFEQWKKTAILYRPQLKQQQFSFLLTQNRVCRTKAENLPTVNFYISAGNNYVYNGFSQRPSIGAGLSLDWTIFDPSNRPRLKQAKSGQSEAAANYFQAELETEAVIFDKLNLIEKLNLAYQSSEEGAVLANESMQMATKKHQLGIMSSFEYRDAIKSQHEAQQQVNQAKFDLRNAYDELVMESGFDFSCKNL